MKTTSNRPAYNKYITKHRLDTHGRWFYNLFIIANSYDRSLKTFKKMIKETRKDFPDLKPNDFECCSVVKSNWCKGWSLIHIFLENPPTDEQMKDYRQCERLDGIEWS